MTISPAKDEITPSNPITRGESFTYPMLVKGMNKSQQFLTVSIVRCLYVKRKSTSEVAQIETSLVLLIDTSDVAMHDERFLEDEKLAMTRLISYTSLTIPITSEITQNLFDRCCHFDVSTFLTNPLLASQIIWSVRRNID